MRRSVEVKIGNVTIGGNNPIAIQSMTSTDTEEIESTIKEIKELSDAGSEIVRIAVNTEEAASAAERVIEKLRGEGYNTPIVGDFHYNGHILLAKFPKLARILDKYRINPGNVGFGKRRDKNFAQIVQIAIDNNKPIRIGVNVGSLDQQLVIREMDKNSRFNLNKSSEEIIEDCMVISAIESVEYALDLGLPKEKIVISCKTSNPSSLIRVYRKLAKQTEQPLHLGLTEAGMGIKGIVWSATAMGVLLNEGIGDTIRVSLTPRMNEPRINEVLVAREILQSLGLRFFAPSVTSCPGCGRTTSTTFRELAQEIEEYISLNMNRWKRRYKDFESIKIAVMGCVVNGPGESKSADIGISLPGKGEEPRCPVYIDGKLATKLQGDAKEIAAKFKKIIEEYLESNYLSSERVL